MGDQRIAWLKCNLWASTQNCLVQALSILRRDSRAEGDAFSRTTPCVPCGDHLGQDRVLAQQRWRRRGHHINCGRVLMLSWFA
jgi:hypothetical protein